MERKLVEFSTEIYVYANYMLVDREGIEKSIRIDSFDVDEGWFDAHNNGGVDRYFMKDYGVRSMSETSTWEPENNNGRIYRIIE
ncbi:MAG: hypothetical protein ABH840_00020 [Nanoarchaeota archaeon]